MSVLTFSSSGEEKFREGVNKAGSGRCACCWLDSGATSSSSKISGDSKSWENGLKSLKKCQF